MKKTNTYAVIGKNIVFKTTNKIILDDLNITVESQSIYAVLGENDSGKSVLLKCLAGILKLDGGDISLSFDASNRDISSAGSNNVAMAAGRPNIGLSSQEFDVPGPMRIYQLLNYIGAVNRLLKYQTIERYDTIATMIEIPTPDLLVSQLRPCQRKILSLVLAIIHEPKLIILDDITSGVDNKTLKNIWTLVSFINESRNCTIIVSANNNFDFMETTVTHIGILVNGKIVEEDTTLNLLNKYEASNINNLLIKIILKEDDQTIISENTRKSLDIKGHIINNDMSPLNSIFITENYSSETRKNVLHTLILNTFCTLAEIKLMIIAVIICMIVLPSTVHFAFSAFMYPGYIYPQDTNIIAVYNEEARVTYTSNEFGECDAHHRIKTMSCIFTEQHLTKSFKLIYVSKQNITNFGDSNTNHACLLYFHQNYSSTLRLRMERKIRKNADFENSQIIIKMSITDWQVAAYVKNKLLEHYKDFLLEYTHKHSVLTNINYESIKYNYITTSGDNTNTICSRFVNSGLIVILAFTFHSLVAVQLLRITSNDYCTNERILHLSHLAVQIPAVIVCNVFTVAYMHVLYNVRAYHGYLFLCLLLESICGITLGNILSLFTKNYLNITITQYFQLIICIYISGLWWPTSGSFSLKTMIFNYLPISLGNHFIRNLTENQYFDAKLLYILFFWTIILVIIAIIKSLVIIKVIR